MIPITPEPGALEYYARNIKTVWSLASADDRTAGRDWYRDAHLTACMLADGDVRKGAGVLAALSPQTSWWLNVELAADAFDASVATRHTWDSRRKANLILRGADPTGVLPMRRKTGHFFRCIVNPSDPDAVCVDRHAHDIAVGVPLGNWNRGLSAYGRYELVASAYRLVASELGVIPSTIQATTWVVWRSMISGTATRGALAER